MGKIKTDNDNFNGIECRNIINSVECIFFFSVIGLHIC